MRKKIIPNKYSSHFLWFLVLLGIIFLFLGLMIPDTNNILKLLSSFLLNIASILITATIATIFINYTDIKKILQNTLIESIVDKRLISNLSEMSRKLIDKEILLCECVKLKQLNELLYDYIKRLKLNVLQNFYIKNYSIDVHLYPYDSQSDLLKQHNIRTFVIESSHLKEDSKIFPLKIHTELMFPKSINIDEIKQQFKFEIKINGNIYCTDAIKRIEENEYYNNFHIEFSSDIEIKGNDDVDVSIFIESLFSKEFNNSIFFVNYPTQGFRYNLKYSKEWYYNSSWLISKAKSFNANKTTYDDGITDFTNDWLMPGEGIIINWFSK